MANEVVIHVKSKTSVDKSATDRVIKDQERRFEKGGRDSGKGFGDSFAKVLSKNVTKALGGEVASGIMTAAKGLGGVAASAFAGQFALVAGRALASALAKLLHGLGSLAALAPAGVLAFAAALGTVKIALSGVADTLSAGLTGDTEAFEEGLEKLAPSARQVAREVVSLKGRLDQLRGTVQQNFFQHLVGQAKPLASIYLPDIERTLAGIATQFSLTARTSIEFFKLPQVAASIDRALRDVEDAVGNVTIGAGDLVRAFVPLVTVGASFLPGLTDGFGTLTERVADFIEEAARTGDLRNFIQGGIDSFGQLWESLEQGGRIVGNFVSGIGALFSDVQFPAGQLADSLERISEQFEAWARQQSTQDRVREIFEFLSEVDWGAIARGAAALATMSTAFRALAGVGGIVQGIVALTSLGAPGLVILGVAAAVAALAAGFVYAYQSSEPFRLWVHDSLIPVLEELYGWFQDKIMPVVREVAEYIQTSAVDAWDRVTEAIERNQPQLEQFAGWLEDIAAVVGPLLVMTLGSIGVGLQVTAILVSVLIDVLGFLVDQFNQTKDVVGAVVSFIRDHWLMLVPVIGVLSIAISGVWRAFQFLGGIARDVFGSIRAIASDALGWVGDRIDDIRGAIRRLRDALGGLGGALGGAGGGALGGLLGFASGGITGAATGGVRNGLTVVGEHGRELVDLAPGSQVHSNPDTERILAVGGGRALRIYVDDGGDPLVRMVMKMLRYEIAGAGGDVQAVLGQG